MNKAIALIRSAVAASDNLLDIGAAVAENPDLFGDRDRFIVRAAAQIGQSVKVGASGEFFWAEIVDRTENGVFFGRVDSNLIQTDMHGLRRDDIIVFGPEHIRVVEDDERFPKPSGFQKCLIMLMPEDGGPMQYNDPMGGDYMTVQEFRESVECGAFIDYDGYGYAVARGDIADTSEQILPSTVERIPEEATHIIWFNK